MGGFGVEALLIIIPFGVAVVFGCLCICKYKISLWRIRRNAKWEMEGGSAKTRTGSGGDRTNEGDHSGVPSDTDLESGAILSMTEEASALAPNR